MNPADRYLTRPIPHATAAGSIALTSGGANYSGTSAAAYTPTGGSGSNVTDLSLAAARCCQKVTISNLEAATKILYVNIGSTVCLPPAATANSFPIFPLASKTFDIMEAGLAGVQGVVNILPSSGTAAGSIQWHP